LYSNISGTGNTALGGAALYYNISGNHNIAVGNNNLISNITGSQNTSIGTDAMQGNKIGSGSVAIGYKALNQDTAASGTVAIGRTALFNNKNANRNIAIGDSALFKNGIGSIYSFHSDNNTAIGSKTLLNNTTGYGNTATGSNALTNNTIGTSNAAFGNSALTWNTTGSENTAMGNAALAHNVDGEHNVAIGQFALLFNNYLPRSDSSQAKYNVGIGSNTFRENFLGSNNTGVGNFAGMRVSGDKNTIIGANTKRLLADPVVFINGAVFLGHNAGSTENTSNKLYIENTSANKDSALIYGDFANDSLSLNGKTIIRDNAVIKGFTKLGGNATDVPAVKIKKLTGTTANASGAVGIAHGLTQSKILSVAVFVNGNTGNDIPPRSTYTGFEFDYYLSPTQIFIKNIATNDANIINRPFRILITYEQ
jgi:trimeric autotransporter adhesin